MTSKPTRAIVALALIAVAGVTAMQTTARSRKPEPVAVEAPPPPPAAPAGLPDRLLADAAAYQAWVERVMATSPSFANGESVAEALKSTSAYDPKALVRGEIAYGAVAALSNPNFVAQVRAAGNSPDNRALMVRYILQDPGYPFNFKGSDAAAGLVKEALGGAGLKIYTAARAMKQSAYDVQHQAWSKEEVRDRPGRLQAVEAAANAGMTPATERVPTLQRILSGTDPMPVTAMPAAPPYTPLVARAMQLAAIAALGEATDQIYDQLTALASDADSDACLHMAKLNLYQCLAVAKPHYEDIFCMGQHVMADTAVCLAHGVGVETPPDPVPPPRAVQAASTKRSRPG